MNRKKQITQVWTYTVEIFSKLNLIILPLHQRALLVLRAEFLNQFYYCLLRNPLVSLEEFEIAFRD